MYFINIVFLQVDSLLSEFILDDLNDPHASTPTSIEEHLILPSFSSSSILYNSSNETITHVKKEVLNSPSETLHSQILNTNKNYQNNVIPI